MLFGSPLHAHFKAIVVSFGFKEVLEILQPLYHRWDVVLRQIVLPVVGKYTFYVKWVNVLSTGHCTIPVIRVQFTMLSAIRALRTHILFQLLIVAQSFSISSSINNNKKLRIYKLFFVDFQNLLENKIMLIQFFVILSIHKPPLCHVRSHKNFWPDRFSRFDVYRLQTIKQAKYI